MWRNLNWKKKVEAKKFAELLEKFLTKDDEFFIYAGLALLVKRGFTIQNLLKYVLLEMSFKKEFYYNVDNILPNNNKNLSYKHVINKLNLFLKSFIEAEDTNLLQLVYSNESFRLIDVSVDILIKDILKNEKNKLSKYLTKKIIKFKKHISKKKKIKR